VRRRSEHEEQAAAGEQAVPRPERSHG
jgi:hypothetical protein